MSPKVSIVLPFRNEEKYLQACMASILDQTFKNWELIAVDDYSTDQSVSIINEFVIHDKRVKSYKNPSRGLVSALNYGISQSQSPLIARMDGDDLMDSQRLSHQVSHLRKSPDIGVVASQVIHFPRATGNQRKGYELYVQWTNSILNAEDHSLNRFIDCPFAHPSVTFRKSLVEKFGGYTDGSFPEDFELWLRWMSKGVSMEKIPKPLLSWRDHPERASRTDKRYAVSEFQKIKAKYVRKWIKNDANLYERKILCWGAGRLARKFFTLLNQEGVNISGFLDPDPKKVGKQIASLPILPIIKLPAPKKTFILILASARGAREQTTQYLKDHGYIFGKDFLPLA